MTFKAWQRAATAGATAMSVWAALALAADAPTIVPVTRVEPPRAEYQQKLKQVDQADAAAMMALGDWADRNRLPDEAVAIFRKVATMEGEHGDAYRRLTQLADSCRLPDEPALIEKLKAEVGPRFSVHVS